MINSSSEYGEGRDPIPGIDEPTIIFMINNSLPKGDYTDNDVYRCTRASWVIGEQARDKAVYALGVSHGVVRGAYRITTWYPEGERRWCFDGEPAGDLNVIGGSIARIKGKRGNSNPVRLFLGGIPPE